MKKGIRITLRIILWSLLAVLILAAALVLLVQLPAVQNFAKRKAVTYLEEKLGTEVALGRIGLNLKGSLFLEDLYMEDQQADTLLSAQRVFVQLQPARLLKNELSIPRITVENMYANLELRADSSFNFDYITAAFDSGERTASPQDSSAASMGISLGDIVLKAIRVRYRDALAASDIRFSLGELQTHISTSDIENMRFGADASAISSAWLLYDDGLAGLRSEVRLGALDLSSLLLDMEKQTVQLGHMELDSSRAEVAFREVAAGLKPFAEEATEEKVPMLKNASGAPVLEEAPPAENPGPAGESEPGWNATIQGLLVKHSDVRFDDFTAEPVAEGMDYMHLHLRNLSADLQDFSYDPSQITGSLKAASFSEKSGFILKELRSNFYYSDTLAAAEELYLETENSLLQKHIRIGYPSIDELTENMGAISIDALLTNSRLAYQDMLLLAPFLQEYEPFKSTKAGSISFNGNVQGRLDDLHISDFEAQTLDQTQLIASAHLKGLPDMEKAWFDIRLEELSSGAADLQRLTEADMIPSSVALPATFSLKGHFKGSMTQFEGEGRLASSYGGMAITGYMRPGEQEGMDTYQARLRMDKFHMGRLLRNDSLGRISLQAGIDGRGTSLENAVASMTSLVEEARFNGYNYRQLNMNGQLDRGQLTLKASMQDPNLHFLLNGEADLSTEYPAFVMDLQLDTLDLQALNLYEDPLRMSLHLNADLPTADPDYLNGEILLDDFSLHLDSGNYQLDTIQVLATASDSLQRIAFDSEFMEGQLQGHFKSSSLFPALMNYIEGYFSLDSLQNRLAAGGGLGSSQGSQAARDQESSGDDAAATANSTARADSSRQQVEFQARIFHPPVLKELLPELTKLDTVQIQARFDNYAGILELDARAPEIRYGDNEVDSLYLKVQSNENSVDYDLGINRFGNPALAILHTRLSGKLANRQADFTLESKDAKRKDRYRIGGTLNTKDQAYIFRFSPDLLLDYVPWNVSQDHLFYYSDSGFYAKNITLSSEGQSLRVNSTAYDPKAPLEISFTDFELLSLTHLAQQDSLAIAGQLNGNARISNLMESPSVQSDLQIDHFSFNQDTVGTIALQVDNSRGNAYAADLSVSSERNQITLKGLYYTEPENGNDFDFDLDIAKLDMATIQSFSFGQISNASGQLSGHFNLIGSVEQPSVLGELNFRQVAFTPAYIQSQLLLEDESIRLNEEGISFQQFTLLDSLRNSAVLNGMIYTSDFTDYRFNLQLTANNFQAMNSTAADNELFYGKLFLDTDVKIRGTMDNPNVDAYLRVNEETDFTMVLPSSEPGVQEREGVVEFVDMDAPPVPGNDSLEITTGISGLNLSADLEIDEEALFTIVVDPENGDNLTVKGNAALSTSMDPNGIINLTGRYEIAEGAYELSFNLIKRRFEIAEGSNITWVGDPYSADVDITAVYIANAAPLELVQDQISSLSQSEKNTYKQKLPFQVELMMQGELMKPEISFNIDLPEKERDVHGGRVYGRLQQLRLQESDLNKQVFALLALNRFVAENPLESVGNSSVSSLARQSVSKLLSEQLNRLAGDLIGGVDLNFDLESTEDYSTGQKVDRTDLNVGLSKSLLNDRIRVNVGSSFGLEGQETRGKASSIAGDVSVDYQLSKDGRYLLRAYRNNEYEGVIEGQIIETGLSFIISLDYDEFKELFQK